MKRFLFLCVLSCVATFGFATTWTVSNVTNRPAQFTDLNAAQSAAADGDTLLVYGGGASYGSFTLQKRLYLIGEGIGPTVPNASLDYLAFDYVSEVMNPNGSVVEGLFVYAAQFLNSEPHHDITFKRCRITSGIVFHDVADEQNIRFESCIVNGPLQAQNGAPGEIQNLIFENCVFEGGFGIGPGWNCWWCGYVMDFDGQLMFRNNLFLNRLSEANLGGVNEVVFENNIFYGYAPSGVANSVFNHNLTYFTGSFSDLPPAGNQGSGNLVDVDPQFENVPPAGGAFSWDWNFNLQSGSPADGSGTLGTDIGLTGGNFPVNGNLKQHPAIPAVLSVNLPTTAVQIGGSVQISIEATSRD
jgi:hypothetical protein